MTRTGACTGCGRCCRTLLCIFDEPTDDDMIELLVTKGYDRLPDVTHEGRRYTRFAREDSCPHHRAVEGGCAIYASRPRLCRAYPRTPVELLPGCGFAFSNGTLMLWDANPDQHA